MRSLYACFPIKSFIIRDSDFAIKQANGIDHYEWFIQLAKTQELTAWKFVLQSKWNDVAKAYAMMMFYYNQGIPDEPYFISPGRNGQSVEYFPNFSHEHFVIKDYFDFYADIYFLKLFSAIDDGLWQLLNVYFSLDIDVCEVTWKNVCSKIANIDSIILDSLKEIYNDDRYRIGKEMRNSITHRLPVGSQGTGISREEDSISFGIHDYVSSKKTVEVAKNLLNFCIEALEESKKLCVKCS
ncbi:MAG: hypothetical protein JXB48_13855 [Candidatus Latescibacteria bacterium]|nr:hypothetical protein [Candidatus Latescibacterota bacterium]